MLPFLIYLTSVFTASAPIPDRVTALEIEIPEIIEAKIITLTYEMFIDSIGHRESNNNYRAVNTLGYMGRFQFGSSTLKTIRIRTSRNNFLQDSILQDSAMVLNLKYNKRRLQKFICKYDGTMVKDSIMITESGILAAAHIAGQGNVKRYFRKKKNTRDAYGTSLEDYLIKFSGYNLELNEQ